MMTRIGIDCSHNYCYLSAILYPMSTCWTLHSLLFVSLLLLCNSFKKPPIVILPGFGNDELDYKNPLNRGEEGSLVANLKKRGYKSVHVVPIKRVSWLNIAKGLFKKEFYTYDLEPRQLYDFYLDAVDRTVRQAVSDASDDSEQCILLGHSAGGWLARASLSMESKGNRRELSDMVAGVCTLGAPHTPPQEGSPDMTRGALSYVHEKYPGAYFKDKFYISVAGTAITSNLNGNKIEKFAVDSYSQVSGINEEMQLGDGVVPLSNAHLDGAFQLTIPKCYHSINAPENYWFGGPDVIDYWLPVVDRAVEEYTS